VNRISQKRFADLCKIHSRHPLHTTLESVQFWCRLHQRWLTFSHFNFNHRWHPPTGSIHVHSVTAMIRTCLSEPGRISPAPPHCCA